MPAPQSASGRDAVALPWHAIRVRPASERWRPVVPPGRTVAHHTIAMMMTIPLFQVCRYVPAGRRWPTPMRLLALFGMAMLWAMAPAAHAQKTIPDTLAQRALACAACHGKEGRATSEGFFPRIAGKPAGYLYHQLINFREGRRQNLSMTYMVDHLSDAYLMEIAGYFSSLNLPYPPPQPVNATRAQLERGRQLVMQGDAANNVPACIACHGQQLTGVAPDIPGLLGLPRDYLNAQFGAWRNGARKTPAPDCMAQITERLSIDDISAVSAWLASQAVPGAGKPAPSSAARLPLPCANVSP